LPPGAISLVCDSWNAVAHAAPISVLLHLAAHAISNDGDAFGPAERREQRLVASDSGPQHLDEAADALARFAGPVLAREGDPGIEARDVVPIGDRDDVRISGLIDVVRAVPMRWTIGGREALGDPRQRLCCRRGRATSILHAEVSHHHAADLRLVARHE
jgi:hypothetical protein